MWKIFVKIEGADTWHQVNGMGMIFPGFHIIDQALSFMSKNLDKYITTNFGTNAELAEVSIRFEDKK